MIFFLALNLRLCKKQETRKEIKESMSGLQIFKNGDFGEIRTVAIDGEPWFVGKDVAKALEYEKPDNAIRAHVDCEDRLTHQISASGQKRDMTIINESGLYSLMLSSKLPKAKDFKRWVTSEVLPTIRKTGSYGTYPPKSTSVGEVARLLNILVRVMEKQGSAPNTVATMAEMICGQFGIALPENFVKHNPFEQMNLFAMVPVKVKQS